MNLDSTEFLIEIIYLIKKNGAYVINFDEYHDIGTRSLGSIVCKYQDCNIF